VRVRGKVLVVALAAIRGKEEEALARLLTLAHDELREPTGRLVALEPVEPSASGTSTCR
jgi:hypothetical protein